MGSQGEYYTNSMSCIKQHPIKAHLIIQLYIVNMFGSQPFYCL